MKLTKQVTILATLGLLFTSCGKHDLPNNILQEVKRVTENVVSETDRVNQRLGAELTRWKKSADINIHYAVKDLGENVENVGQFPRDIINKALGTSQDTNEKQDELDRRVDDLEKQLEALRADLNTKEANLNNTITTLEETLYNQNEELTEADNAILSEVRGKYRSLLRLIGHGQRHDAMIMMYLISKTNQLQRDVDLIIDYVDNLEVMCYNDDILGIIMMEFYCQLESDNY